jgi:hypothetical protein
MAYDNKTYGASPFGKSVEQPTQVTPVSGRSRVRGAQATPEALSDQIGEHATEEHSEESVPALPSEYASTAKSGRAAVSVFYIPRGRLTGLNMIGEGLGWLMAWGTVGFFRAYVPTPVLMLFDRVFNPWGMASITLVSALLIGQLLRRYQLKIISLRTLATTAIEYGEIHQRAEAQNHIDTLLSQAAGHTETASRWMVSGLTALGCLFIIGAFY